MGYVVGAALIVLGVWFLYRGWRGFFIAIARVRLVLRSRRLAEEILRHFRNTGAQHIDLERFALILLGEAPDAGLKSLSWDRRKKAERLVQELIWTADRMCVLEPYAEFFDFDGDGSPERMIVPGLYMLSAEGRPLLGG